MIPRLSAPDAVLLPAGLFDALVEAGFRGDMERGADSRTVFATDNSIYQIPPAAVIFPRDADDLRLMVRVLARPEFRTISVTPRGGGTGTNGQSLADGLVVDCSRHMTRILSIDVQNRRARVEAGVVKDQLNRALAPHGLFFAPELSTSNRATIGGMIATDACGQGSCLYGKTSAHVRGLRLVLADGTEHWSAPVDKAGLAALLARADRLGQAVREVVRIERDEAALIAATYPDLNRFLTGYDLAHLRDGAGRFDLNSLICGSEGTLAFVTEAELNLLPIPAHSALITVQYASFDTALEDARLVASLAVASVETMDEKVLSLAKGDLGWQAIAQHFPDSGQRADGVNLIEVLADTPTALEAGIDRVHRAFADEPLAGRGAVAVARTRQDIAAIWAMRKRAVGLLGAVSGPARPVAFVEDTAVPPAKLAPYIREFRALLDAEGLDYGMFGHVDAGVLHVRPALDLTAPDLRQTVRRVTDGVVALTRRYGGVLWGEHGKGLRSEYVPDWFGPLYPSLQRIKAAFDPDNRLNPGKIAAPPGQDLTRLDAPAMRGDHDRGLAAGFGGALACNGNGACFDFDPASAMCPSYKATRDRRQSPKGRAALLREWLRLLRDAGVDPRATRPASVWRRLWNTANPANRGDFSHQVNDAMAGCLSCKACAGQCPVKVDVPEFKARFIEVYHGRYLRPFRHHIFAVSEYLLPLVSRFPNLSRLVTGRVLALAGITDLPQPQTGRFPTQGGADVVFVADRFTRAFDPAVLVAACTVAQAMGLRARIETVTIGKPLQIYGFLARFEAQARRTTARLARLQGVTLVGIDPAMTLTLRDEYAKLGLQTRVLLPQEWLLGAAHRLPALSLSGRLRLMLHCTERSTLPSAAADWRSVFARLGAVLETPAAGCCGMAGTFGHDTANSAVSQALFGLWADALADATVMATGFSCRSQATLLADRRLPHPLEILSAALPAIPQTRAA